MMVDGSPNRGVTVANPTDSRREGPTTSPQNQVVQENANAKEESESKVQPSTPATKLEASKASTSSVQSSRSRWLKLRTTVQLTGAITQSHKKHPLKREDSFLKRFSTRQVADTSIGEGAWFCHGDINKDENKRKWWITVLQSVINPDENFLFGWLWLMTVCILYNAWTLIVRQAFPELRTSIAVFWFTVDGLSDFVFLLDIMVQFRTGYLEQGLMVCDAKKLACHYLRSRPFLLDVAALTPLDMLQFHFGQVPILRFSRFLKLYRAIRFYYMAESRTIYPNLWRVVNLVHILLLLAHWFGCFYYMLSELEEFQGEWAYPRLEGGNDTLTRKYLGSVYWSTLTLTTIGDLATPATNLQYLFTIVSYLIGVFIFATIVGQVGNVITNRNASRLEFERLLDGAKLYMRHHKVPRNMQRRVQRWYDYSWSRGRMQGGGDIHSALGSLPDKLKTELALHVNLKTLKKVSIFQECQPEFLHDLVLKMKAYIFTPGDLICRKGEVAREMFIIADGILEVISEMGKVLTQMKAGDFFGEIGILNLDGFNRRTADVRSVGYSELFSLSREDVLSAMKDYPEAQEILQTMGRKRLMEARLAASTGKKHEETNRSPNSLKALRNRDSIDAGSGPKPREMVKRLKHDVQSLRGLLRSKSIPVRKPDDDEEMELHSITSDQKKSLPSEEDSMAERNSSLRRIMKMIRWKGDRQTSQPIKGIVRRISRAKPPLTRESTKSSEISASRRTSSAVSEPPMEPIGAGLPLLERLKLLKERERQRSESNRSNNSHTDTQNNPPAYSSHNDNSGTIIGEGLPLIQRLKLLKEKEAATCKNVDVPTLRPSQEARSELPLLKRVLLLKQEEPTKIDGSVSSSSPSISSAEEPSKKLFKKPNSFQQLCRNMQPQRQSNCHAEEEPSISSRRQSISSSETAQESQPLKPKPENGDSASNEQVRNESPRPHFLDNTKTEFSLSVVREHSQSPPLQEDCVSCTEESIEKVPKTENNSEKCKQVEDSPSQEDEHAVRRKRLKRMMAFVDQTCESSDHPQEEEPDIISKDAWCQTDDAVTVGSQEEEAKPEPKTPLITKSSEMCQSSDSDYKDDHPTQLLGDELYSPIEDLSPFDDGIQEYLLKIMKNVKQAMKTYVIERQSELEAKVTDLEEELRRKETTIRKLHFLSKKETMPLSSSAMFDDISSLDNTDVSSPESETEADLLCPTTLRSTSLEDEPEKPKLFRHRYSWPSRSPAKSRKDRHAPSSRSFEEPEPMSGLDFHPEEIWRVEFPANDVTCIDSDNPAEDEEEMSSSSESDLEETVMEPHDWEARMLVQEFERNRRKSAEDVMLWNWMVNRRSLQDWRRHQRQNNDNKTKRKHSLVDARTLNSWTTGDGSFYIRDSPHFVSTEDLRASTKPKRDQFRQFRRYKRTERTLDTSSLSRRELRRHKSLREDPRLVSIDKHQWTSLDDTRPRDNEGHQTKPTTIDKLANCTSDVTSGVLGWPSSPCLPTITEDDVSRPSNAPSIVSRSYSQDCLVTAHWSGATANTEDGNCERHSESEHGEDSPLIPFAQCSDESVVISLPEYEALLDLDP